MNPPFRRRVRTAVPACASRRGGIARAALAAMPRLRRAPADRTAASAAPAMSATAATAALVLALGLAAAPRAAAAAPITVAAAASLRNAMRDVGAAYRAAHPQAEVDFSFAASGTLLAQLAHGAPVDVFASADRPTMDQAEARRLVVAATRVDFATNALVLVAPRTRRDALRTLADLTRADVARIAIGQPASVPAGRYAQSALEQAGLWAVLAPKLVFAENVRQSLQYVSRAEADAGFVYRTDALIDRATVRIEFTVPGAGVVHYPIARVAASRHGADADRFIAFVASPAGRAALARHGFGPP